MIKSKRFESGVFSATQKMMEYIRDYNITREQIISVSHAEYGIFDAPILLLF